MQKEQIEILQALIGAEKTQIWQELCKEIESLYDMDITWGKGGKNWNYEYKYRRGGKTLCALYAKENSAGLLIIFGKDERQKIDENRQEFSMPILKEYDDATTYHDGKWVMFDLKKECLNEYIKLLAIKRKPNKK